MPGRDTCNTWRMPASPAPFCQLAVGDIDVTFVPDGYIYSEAIPSFPGSTPEMWSANAHLLDDAGLVVMSLGALLIRTADQLVMVDLGWGPSSMEFSRPDGSTVGGIGGGRLLDNLAALGVRPANVDAVLFSHLHSDHTGWIVDPATSTDRGDEPGSPLFPNATNYLSQAEWDFWSTRGPDDPGPRPTPEQLAVLGSRLAMVEDGEAPFPGINVMATPGHTPGHLSFVISSGNERAVVLGDAVHCPIEIQQPELTFVTDVDPALAQRTRAHIEQELLNPGTVAAAPHFADLVFGRLMPGQGRASWQFPDSQRLSVPG
jgi:glyoxylase-like metal-dependent hydrolase (beta-lactamase superfamily II)